VSDAEGADSRPDIVIVGAGLQGYAQLTREALATLRSARQVFFSGYNGDLRFEAAALCPQATVSDLEEGEYVAGTYRPSMYERLARRVIEAARAGPGVVVLQPGSAMVVDTVTQVILSEAATLGLDVQVVPGVSSLETVLVATGYDAAGGLQVLLAQDLVLRRRRLDPTLTAIVMQPGYYDTLWWAGAARSRPDRFVDLATALGRAYPPETPMALVLSPLAPEDPVATTFWFRMRDLADLHRLISPFHTLFIPQRETVPEDSAFRERIDSWAATLERFECDEDGRPRQEPPSYWFSPSASDVPERLVRQSRELALQWVRHTRSAEPQGAPGHDAPVVGDELRGAFDAVD
jgi:precorrin-2 methylase